MMSRIVGIDIGGTKMLMYSNYDGKVIEEKVPTGSSATPESLTNVIHDFVNRLDYTPDALGVCVPGLVEKGVLILASDRRNLEGISEDMLSTDEYRAYIINDIRAAMYSQIPKYPKNSSICVIVVGTGIGMSVMMNGHFISGAKGFIGEIGMCPMRLVDGSISTYENIMNGRNIVEKCNMEPPEIVKKLDAGDTVVTRIVEEAAEHCGLALSYVINLFNPEYIILTGSTTTYRNYRSIAINTCKKYAIPESWDACTFVDPPEGGRIVLLGTMEFARMRCAGMNVY